MKRKLDSRTRADIMRDQGYCWLAGKWFLKGKEAPETRRELLVNPIYQCKETDDADKAMAFFIGAYGDPRAAWPRPPIVDDALALIASCASSGKELPPMAYPLSPRQLLIVNRLLSGEDEMMFIATGTGGSGKSTFGNIVRQIFGDDCAYLNLQELSDDFHLATGVGKRLIYSDELNAEAMRSNVVKVLASKQDLTINPKFGKPYAIRWQGELFFCTNVPPKLDVSDPGLMRRMCYFYMDKRIAHPDPKMQKRDYTRPELVAFAAHALQMPTACWFEAAFAADTHRAIETVNSVWKTKGQHDGDYGLYKQACLRAGYKTFAEDKFDAIWKTFQQWEEEDRETEKSGYIIDALYGEKQ